MKINPRITAILIGLALLSPMRLLALDVRDVRVVGLFKGTAVVKVAGKQRLLKVGQQSPEGVLLLAANGSSATIKINDVEHQLRLSRDISKYQAREEVSVSITLSEGRQYLTSGSVNGRSVQFLVDTGATSVALNTQQARSLGIDFASGQVGQAGTAGGVVKAYFVTLDSVKVGEIEVKHVKAAVLEGIYPSHALLGMSYLGQVKMTENAGVMTLTKKF